MPDDRSLDVRLAVNGRSTVVRVHPMARLLDVLRHELHLTGTKEGCGEGECGACSVLIDGQLVNSCLTPILQVDGATITTIEGVAEFESTSASERAGAERGSGPGLHILQQAFIQYGGAQC